MLSLILAFISISVAFSGKAAAADIDCNSARSCRPYDLENGPFCRRNGKLPVRISIDLAPENGYVKDGVLNTMAAYAACLNVDEAQAIDLSEAGKYVATVVSNSTQSPKFSSLSNGSWVYVNGFGGKDDKMSPRKETSDGAVMIFDALEADKICDSQEKKPLSTFLVLSVALNQGRFVYSSSRNQPAGVGFQPTCDGSGKCLLKSGLPCIGPPGRQNCAECLTATEIANADVNIWVSYVGTDSNGRSLKSGTSNPLNYRLYGQSKDFNL